MLGLGAFLGAHYQPAPAALAEETRRAETAQTAALRADNARLAAQIASLRAEQSRALASRPSDGAGSPPAISSLDDLMLLASLQEKKWVRSSMGFVKPNGQLDPAFTELFKLTPVEQTVLQEAVDRAREQLHVLEQANATVTRNERGDVMVAVKPFAKAGGAVYDELMKSFAQVLGPQRNAAYLTLGSEQVEKALAGFGGWERVVTFSYNPAAPEGRPRYSVRDDRKDPSNHMVNNSDYKRIEEIVDRAGTIVRFLPPDFGEKK
jgi:hypothetical protein